MHRWLRAISRLSLREKVDLLRVLLLLAYVEVGIRLLPLPRLTRRLGVNLRLSGEDHASACGDARSLFLSSELRRMAMLSRVMRHWPFGAGPCLRQSLALGRLLRNRQPALRIGVARKGEGVQAHAWLQVAGVVLGEDTAFLPLGAAENLVR